MKRYFAAFYRGRWLYALALLLMVAGAAAGTYVMSRTQFEATARIWVDKPPLDNILEQTNAQLLGYTTPPAQRQADKLYQLIQTDSFMIAIIKGTKAGADLTGDPDKDRRTLARLRKKLAIGALGPNTMAIAFVSTDPELCQQVVQGTIDSYRTWIMQTQAEQNSVEVLFYQGQLKGYEDQLAEANRRLNEYQVANPRVEPMSPQYLELQRLQDEVRSAQGLYSAAKARIDQAGIVQNLADKSGRSEFQILDKPSLPQRPAAGLSKLAKYFGLGAAASLAFVLAIGVFTAWQDTSIRSAEDLARITNLPVLQVLPPIKEPKRRGRKADGAGQRPAATLGNAIGAGQGAD